MAQTEQELLHELTVHATRLATLSKRYVDHIRSEDGRSEMIDAFRAVEGTLIKCPVPSSVWDGTIRDDDIEETQGLAAADEDGMRKSRKAVTLTHRITGISRLSYSKPTLEENREVAREALELAVNKRYQG